jgi:hypothetical protein
MAKQITKHQHFVPKMYLKNFAKKTKAKRPIYTCYVFDKETNTAHKENTENICFIDYLYEAPGWAICNDVNKIENWLGLIEAEHEPKLTKFLQSPHRYIHNNKLDEPYRSTLFILFTSLLLRHPHVLNVASDITEEMGIHVPDTEKPILGLKILAQSLYSFASGFCKKYDAIILENQTSVPFVTADMPIGFTINKALYKLYYLPLSPHYALLLLPRCVSLFPRIQMRMRPIHDAVIPCSQPIAVQCNEILCFTSARYTIATNLQELRDALPRFKGVI